MDGNVVAWLVLRIVYAWMFLYPLYGLIKNWNATVQATRLLFPFATSLFAIGSLLIMFFGALSILLGFYGQIGATALLLFNLGGAFIHYQLANIAKTNLPSLMISESDKNILEHVKTLAVVGHVTSAQKNFPLAAIAFFILLEGTGPYSIINHIF